MSKRDKRLERLRENPQGWSIDELEQVMLDYGISRRPGGKGSHRRYGYTLNDVEIRFTIAVHGKLKPEYVKRVRQAVEEIIKNG